MAEKLKNRYFTASFIDRLLRSLSLGLSSEKLQSLKGELMREDWEALELKERMQRSARFIRPLLPENFEKTLPILERAAKEINGLEGCVFPAFVQEFGIAHFEESMAILEKITPYSSAEFAVRPFIENYTANALVWLKRWAKHENEHVRRLSSEGCRPRLPWASQLPQFIREPDPVLAQLALLMQDPSLYVRKSVANNINDLSKDHPDKIIQWCGSFDLEHPYTFWIVKHGLRTLIKNGHLPAMRLLGLVKGNIAFASMQTNASSIKMGESIQVNLALVNKENHDARAVLDYALHFKKSNGKNNKKVFKWKEINLKANERIELQKSHKFIPLTTRKYYAGEHQLDILLNGEVLRSTFFQLDIS